MAARLFSQESVCRALASCQPQENGTERNPLCEILRPKYVSYDPLTDTVEVSFLTHNWCPSPCGMLYSGIVSAMLDAAAGALTYSVVGKYAPAVSTQVHFLHPVEPGELLIVRSKVAKKIHPFFFLTLEAFTNNFPDELAATSSGIYYAG